MINGPLTSSGAVHGTMPSVPQPPNTLGNPATDGITSAITPEKLTAQNESKWADTTAMMAWTAPGFRHIWFKMLTQAQGKGASDYAAVMTKRIPVAATDGQNLLLNPDTFFEYKLRQRVFIGAHEILHNVFDDVNLLHKCNKAGKVPMNDGSTLPFVNETMQIAMDLRNNAILIDSKIGSCPDDAVASERKMADGTVMPKVTGQESVLDIYKMVYDAYEQQQGGQPGQGTVMIDVLQPGNSTGQGPAQAAAQRNPQQWAIEIQAAQTLEEIRSQGKMAMGLQRMFQNLLEPEISWLDHIETLIHRHTGSGGRDWRTPDQWFIGRDIYLPSKTGYGAGWIVIWGDTSGSRSDVELTSNMAELHGILEDVQPKRLTILWCDAHVDYVDEIEDPADLQTIQARGTGGGGGTSFQPVLDWIGEQGEMPELFIGFTDGYVDYPKHEPPFPTIWASSTDYAYPYGQVVRVNKVSRG